MKNIVKNSLYTAAWLLFIAQSKLSLADLNFWADRPDELAWAEWTADQAIMNLVQTLATFLSLLAVLFALWGWFNILTAAWDEEKVKKWKTILVQALLWLVVIWLSYSIVNWLVTLILGGSTTN